MDIYFGSSQKIPESYRNGFIHFTSLGEFIPDTPSEYLNVLKQQGGESLIIANNRFEIIFDGYISGLKGKSLEDRVIDLAGEVVGQISVDYSKYNGLYNLCVREKNTGNIWLTSNPAAMLPLYYYLMSNTLFYSSHMYIMTSVLNLDADYAGIAQKVSLGYTLGSRTLFKGLERLNPGETIFFSNRKAVTESYYKSVYYTSYYNEKNIEALLFESMSGSFKKMHQCYDTVGLMLSEGFDSRFLGGIAKMQGFNIKSYTHVTPGAGGQAIVEKVSKMLNSEHHFQSMIDGYSYDRSQLEKQLYLADNLNYPYWMLGSDFFRLQSANYPIIIGSSLDCILDGNIFLKPSKQKSSAVRQRYTEIIKQNAGLLTKDYIERLSSDLIKSLFTVFPNGSSETVSQTFQPDISLKINVELQCLNDHIKIELKRLSNSGSLLPSQQLQRFTLENRDRKLFFGQPLTIRKYNKLYIPSFEYSFLNLAGSINPSFKLHHKLYRRILKKFLPEQLKIENGTFGLAPRYPRIILETSRFVHKSTEKKLYRKLLEKRGDINLANFRSASIFELCGRSEKTHNGFNQLLADNKEILNYDKMKLYIDQAWDYKIRTFNYERLYRGLEICQVVQKHI